MYGKYLVFLLLKYVRLLQTTLPEILVSNMAAPPQFLQIWTTTISNTGRDIAPVDIYVCTGQYELLIIIMCAFTESRKQEEGYSPE
jgi:hypothetical protein